MSIFGGPGGIKGVVLAFAVGLHSRFFGILDSFFVGYSKKAPRQDCGPVQPPESEIEGRLRDD